MNQKAPRKSNFNFIIITIIFFGGLTLFQFFMMKNMKTDFDIVNSSTYFTIREDFNVEINTDVTFKANDEKSYTNMVRNFNTPDEEKFKVYNDQFKELNEKIGKNMTTISYQSTVTENNPEMSVNESVLIEGLLEKKEDNLYEFSLKGQPFNVKDNVYIYFPENWVIEKIDPAPNKIANNFVLYSNSGNMDFPIILFRINQ
ncbi:DUF4897 domain-containing protein [Oceanotoga sp. DSM 15011]|jgi:hypothetical protein|uniref:Uncharacterized protein DUF4897 n=1 Tax=Oceanotoga teriensis TaxID=515440 RepID=A0AA45HJR1_9BACT|nr:MULTISPECIES: DUF4897 domain-containing protein [Oceanotoga]MDN5342071.1 hypothetical protein [Oceanotoga sp.]PWJ96253.1 uncharacterized protein DUF4897 [Oceanotoga teriensis]UYP00037.1 DUF4897 domain-containing protein [Oceanotoga sp. DSM 15011]